MSSYDSDDRAVTAGPCVIIARAPLRRIKVLMLNDGKWLQIGQLSLKELMDGLDITASEVRAERRDDDD